MYVAGDTWPTSAHGIILLIIRSGGEERDEEEGDGGNRDYAEEKALKAQEMNAWSGLFLKS